MITYLLYLALTAAIVIKVGFILHKNGRIFLISNFSGSEIVADAVNNLLLAGFYLVNFGFVLLTLQMGDYPSDPVEAIEFLSTKIGMATIVLGVMHFINMYVLANLRKFSSKKQEDDCSAVAVN